MEICMTLSVLEVHKLDFLAEMIMNTVFLTNITSDISVTKFCNLQKYIGIVTQSSASTLIGLCLIILPLTTAQYMPKIDVMLLVSFIVIWQLGRSLLVTTSLFLCSEGGQPYLAVHVIVWISPPDIFYIPRNIFLLSVRSLIKILY